MHTSMIRALHSFHSVRSATFATSCHINQFVKEFSHKIKRNPDDEQCPIRRELFAALDGFPTASLDHPCPLGLLSRSLDDIYRPLNPDKKLSLIKMLADNPLSSEAINFPDTFSSTLLLTDTPASASLSPTSALLYSLSLCREGLEFVLQIKTDLKSLRPRDRESLSEMEHTLHQVVAFWSRRQFLTFKQVTMRSSEELKKNIILAEGVHPISTREEFERRVSHGKCFAVTHTQLSPNVPLSMIYCAPIDYFPTHIQPLLNAAGFRINCTRGSPNTVCFYSVSNAHAGFGGTEIAHQLIKYAVNSLQQQFPSLTNFLTLSPIPQFRKWLASNHILPEEFSGDALERFSSYERAELLKVCANFLANAKRGKQAADPVANFHLKNGASLWKINWLANPNERGMSQSYGIMANYFYDLESLESNRVRYLNEGVVNTSPIMRKLL